ncbi:MAG TPA: class I SAM-dependent methyltransferase [Solirubrobacterales bacterium]|nr:class I SAM-dependent methyltransferase [Solirubrobacterales bacterium]
MEERVYRLVYEQEEEHWWFRGRRAVISAMLAQADRPEPPRVLDAGCGTGRNLELYASLGEAEGVDPSPEAVGLCRQRGLEGVRVGDAEDLPFEDERFGLVAATDVIEHVPDDRAALAEMRRVAAPGARLLLTVPAYAWLWTAEDDRLGHYRRYTLGELRERCRGAGWSPELGTYFNSLLLAPIALARRLPGRDAGRRDLERTPAALNGPLSLPMRAEAALIRRGLRLPAGVSVALLCRRA